MEAKMNVKIQGEASPNRIALSIIKTYLKLYPQSNLSDLRNAFPNSLNPVCASKQIFMTEKDINKHLQNGEAWYATGRGYFLKENEWLIMPDGERVGFVSMWTKPSLERLIAKAKGIIG